MTERDLWVDFNDADRQYRISTLLRFADTPGKLFVGARVLVGDDEGNRCFADVIAIGDDEIDLVLDPGTFHAAGEPEHAESLLIRS